MTQSRNLKRTLAIALPLLAGAAITVWLVTGRMPPPRAAGTERVHSVAAIQAPSVEWIPRATGYGVARPSRVWRAVAEVSGRIVFRAPGVESGAILPKGTIVLRIERADYELAVAEAQAAIAAQQARLDDLKARESSIERSLAIERQRLALAQRDLQRQRELFDKGSVSRAVLDAQHRETLLQSQSVQELENSLEQIPAERRRLEAELAGASSRLRQARLDLPRTSVEIPFDLRVSAAPAEVGQYVSTGELLLEGDGVGATEVEAEVPLAQFRAILDPLRAQVLASAAELDDRLRAMDLSAEVRLRTSAGDEPMVRWPARVDRISDAIDPRTRTVGVVVVVEKPYERARPPQQPPLVKGMYVEVAFCAPARPATVVLPRTAVHEGRVYVADGDDRLAIREPQWRYRHGGFVVVGSGIEPGERVVISDPVPAIAGMKLAPQLDADTNAALVAEAQGAGRCP